MTGPDEHGLVLLPLRPRPVARETVNRYIQRLAAANHLRPSYLHSLLRVPFPGGAVSPERLAALSGRSAQTLERTLTGLGYGKSKPRFKHADPGVRPYQDTVDAWTSAEPGISGLRIWQRLVDEHAAEIGYNAIRNYVRSRSSRAGINDKTTPETLPRPTSMTSPAPTP